MNYVTLGNSNLSASAIGLGCMRIANIPHGDAEKVVETAVDQGINFFDHADIYSQGECESIFGRILHNSSVSREDILIQSKCGIRKGFFDFSKEHILKSVEGSLLRMGIDYLDTLLLHRPDALMEPEEVSEAFDQLYRQGKVRFFGVSNQKPSQVELLKQSLNQQLIVNQLQFGVMHTGMIDQGFYVNMKGNTAVDYDDSVLDYCRLQNMTIQAWSPYQVGFFEGVFIDNPKYPIINQKLEELAAKYNVSKTAIATAWILRHPAKIQTIIGTMNVNRIEDISKAASIQLNRQEWYEIYIAAGHALP